MGSSVKDAWGSRHQVPSGTKITLTSLTGPSESSAMLMVVHSCFERAVPTSCQSGE